MREIILDTETTGLDPLNGDRIVEIGAVEVINSIPTGNSFHQYICPQCTMPAGAFRVHGLSDTFLADKPLFAEVVESFFEFWAGDRLVIHNAAFDVAFLNAEFGRVSKPHVSPHLVVDTLSIARRKHAGASNSLDALCTRYGIDSSRRTKHGALLDAEILAEVYLELTGGRQAALALQVVDISAEAGRASAMDHPVQARPHPLPSRLTEQERMAHAAFVGGFSADALWLRYRDEAPESEAATLQTA